VLATGADVLALSELNPQQEQALGASAAADRYLHRTGASSQRADGMVVWSTLPMTGAASVELEHRDGFVLAIAACGERELRLVFAHPHPPTTRRGLQRWTAALAVLERVDARDGTATLIVADLNAARWHPPLRRLLHAGWRDAHEEVGRGLSASWPANGRWPVPFVRLDHALAGDGVDVVAVRDVDLPGSDHRGFVVTVTIGEPDRATSRPALRTRARGARSRASRRRSSR
jgi:endonuclease/exonuclease/phosphatase (EEP) superfamily protein YafD